MHTLTLAQICDGLEKGDFSSVEITQHLLQRIKDSNTNLNSFITITEDLALEQAKAADAVRATQNAGPYCGLPIAHKDIFCTEGVRTSCGSKMLDNFISPYDADIVERFKHAGTVMLGKTNMDEFAMGSSNETSYYGPVHNPWRNGHVPGGSSGGSAAAVAARLVPGATATDTGGSIRQPASFCGVTGLKPTYGRVSRYGMIAFASSLDQAGPMTTTAEDAAIMLNIMSGFDQRDSTSIDKDVPDYRSTLNNSIDGLRIGLPTQYFNDSLDPAIRERLEAAIKIFEKMGASCKEVDLSNSPLSVATYYVIAPAEASSNLSRFDGVRFGHRCDNPENLLDLYQRSRSEGFGDEVKRRIMIGTYALSAGYYDAYYVKAQKVRRLIKNDFDQAFSEVDLILGPSSPSTSFKIGEKSDDPVAMYLSDLYTIATNLAGLPALSIPAGFIDELPIGMQLIAPAFEEARLLNVAHRYQQESDWHQQIPEAYA